MKKVNPSQVTGPANALVLTPRKGEMLIDSRVLAGHLGNQHKAVLTLIDRYADRFRSLHQVTFQMEVGRREQGGGNSQRYALLNEDQAYFLLSLSRNTDRVVDLKAKLVRAFSEARQAATQHKVEYLPTYRLLHDQIHTLASGSENEKFVHMNVNKLVNKAAGLEAGQRASAPLHQQSLLTVAQAVAANAMSDATDHRAGYLKAKVALNALQSCTEGLVGAAQRVPGVPHGKALQTQ